MRFIRSQKHKPQILFGNYIYNKKIVYGNGNTVWRCAEVFKYKCSARLILNGKVIIKANVDHNHMAVRKINMIKKEVLSDQELKDLFPDFAPEFIDVKKEK